MMNLKVSAVLVVALAACQGPAGPQGSQGVPGSSGNDGAPGQDGKDYTPPARAVAFSTFPDAVPQFMSSHSFQAQAASELGGRVKLAADTSRNLTKVSLVMVNYSNMPSYVWPITLKLYALNDLTTPFAYTTRTFSIPGWKHVPDLTCDASGSAWRDEQGNCHYSETFPISFDLTGTVVPDEFVWTVAYNTQSWGADPTGAWGYECNLNVGVLPDAPSAGELGDIYVYSHWTGTDGPYHDSGAGDVLRAASAWTKHPAVKFEVAPP
jgi:hypothetical protein